MSERPTIARVTGLTKRSGRPYAWLQGVLSGVATALFPGPALLAAFLLAPGLLALLLDHDSGKPSARAILLLGAVGTAPSLVRFWRSVPDLGGALALLGDPSTIGLAWLCAACGWLLTRLAPLLVRYALNAAATARLARLNGERARLVDAWSLSLGPREKTAQAAAGSIS